MKKYTLPLILIFLTGYLGLALELIVLRQAANFVGSAAAITSIVIGAYLGAMTVGYFFGTKKFHFDINKAVSYSLLTIAALIVLGASYPLVSFYFNWMLIAGIYSPIIQTFIYSVLFLTIAPFLFGFNTAALSQTMHESEKSNAGIIMGVGTIGSVLGSIVTTLVFMALLGTGTTVIITVLFAVIGAFLAQKRPAVLIAAIAILGVAWLLNSESMLQRKYGIVSNNSINTVAVIEDFDSRYLLVDSAVHSVISKDGTKFAEYINFIDENFIKTIPQNEKKNILVLGAGGFTVGHNDGRNIYTFVDIDGSLKKTAEKYFLQKPLKPNKNFVVSDAGQFLKVAEQKYDLIIMDIFSRWSIPESAITMEFMQNMKSRLRTNGVIVMNTIANPSFDNAFSQKLDNTIRSVFKHNLSRQIIGAFNGWGDGVEANILYIYHNIPNNGKLYTPDKNFTGYDK